MRRVILSTFFLGLCAIGYSQNGIADWDFSSSVNYGDSLLAADLISSDFVQEAVLIRGAGVKTNNNGAIGCWGGVEFTEDNLTNAIAAGDFITIEITPKIGKVISYTRIAPYNIRHSASGPDRGQWQYSVDGGITFENIDTSIIWGALTTSSGNNQSAIDLSGIPALQGQPEKVIFRLVNWGGTGSSGTWYLNSTSAVPTTNKKLEIQTAQPLPIVLKDFRLVKHATYIALNWITSEEIENVGFIIERMAGKAEWEQLSFVESQSKLDKSSLDLNYCFLDKVPERGGNFYRLKQINLNGSTTYSKVLFVDFKAASRLVIIYPNPVQQELKIAGAEGIGNVELYDLFGKLLHSWEAQDLQKHISLNDLQAGNYFLKIYQLESGISHGFFADKNRLRCGKCQTFTTIKKSKVQFQKRHSF